MRLPLFSLFKGLPLTLITLVGMLVVWFIVLGSQQYWQPLSQAVQISIESILPAFLLITAIFAAQFNRSRFSLMCYSWLLLFVTQNHQLPWSALLVNNSDWLALTFLFLFVCLSLIKDRALLSIHGITRFILIIGCGGLAYLWLLGVQTLEATLEGESFYSLTFSFIPLKLPLIFCGVFLLLRSLFNKDLFQSCLLVSYIIWALYTLPIDMKIELVPWSLALALLSTLYLLAVIIDAYYLAYRDDLTALPSRRALNQYALSLGRKYTVAMIDIDHFKKFNDTYGHDIGDQVLKLVASKLAKVKGGGRVFRYGGEEFTVVFARKTLSQSLPELELLRQSIADYKIVIRQPQRSSKKLSKPNKKQSMKSPTKTSNKTVGVTISIGVAEHQGKQKFEQCLKASDQALYRAKNNGRNNVSH